MSTYRDKKINNKLEFLNHYNKNVKIIKNNELDDYRSFIPAKWFNDLKEDEINKKIEKVLKIWEESVFNELNKTIKYLKNNLIEVDLIIYNDVVTNKEKISILYTIKQETKKEYDISYFEGNFNIEFDKNNILEQNWKKIPKKLFEFYTNIHNGFHFYGDNAGLDELKDVTYLNNYYDIEDFEEYENLQSINLEMTFGFFSNGAGDYVAIDISRSDENNAIVLYHDDFEESYNVNFWNEVDKWIVDMIE